MNCCKCKPGYKGTQCKYCDSEDLTVSGIDGFVNENGQGVQCSKFLISTRSKLKIVNMLNVLVPISGTYNIIIAGGADEDRRKLSTVEILGDSTCSLPNLPYGISNGPQMFLDVNQDGKKEVVVCGTSSNPNRTSCLKLDGGSWSSFADLKKERYQGHVAVSMEDKTFIYGGYENEKSSEILKHGSESWTEGPAVPGKGIRYGSGVAISKDELILIGGWKTEYRIIKYTVSNDTWTYEPDLKTERNGHKCAWFQNQIFVTGGWQGLKSVDILTFDPFNIVKGNDFNIGRHLHGFGLLHHQGKLTLTAFGGTGSAFNKLDSVEVFDDTTGTWKLSKSLKLSEKKDEFQFLSVPSHIICP